LIRTEGLGAAPNGGSASDAVRPAPLTVRGRRWRPSSCDIADYLPACVGQP